MDQQSPSEGGRQSDGLVPGPARWPKSAHVAGAAFQRTAGELPWRGRLTCWLQPFQPPTAARKRQNAFPHASKRRHCIELSATKECQAGQHPTRWHHRRESEAHFRINLDNNFTLPSEYALCCCRFANLWLKSLPFEMRQVIIGLWIDEYLAVKRKSFDDWIFIKMIASNGWECGCSVNYGFFLNS